MGSGRKITKWFWLPETEADPLSLIYLQFSQVNPQRAFL